MTTDAYWNATEFVAWLFNDRYGNGWQRTPIGMPHNLWLGCSMTGMGLDWQRPHIGMPHNLWLGCSMTGTGLDDNGHRIRMPHTSNLWLGCSMTGMGLDDNGRLLECHIICGLTVQ